MNSDLFSHWTQKGAAWHSISLWRLANTLHSRSSYHSPTMNMQTTLIPPCSDHGCFASSKPLEPIAGHSASALTWDAAACESLFLHYFCISEPSINKYWKREYYFFPLRFFKWKSVLHSKQGSSVAPSILHCLCSGKTWQHTETQQWSKC